MPMLEGTVTIDPNTGAAVTLGLAGEIFSALDAETDYGTLQVTNPKAYANARKQLAVIAKACAKVVPHIVANALVNGTSGSPVPVQVAVPAGTGATTGPVVTTGTIT